MRYVVVFLVVLRAACYILMKFDNCELVRSFVIRLSYHMFRFYIICLPRGCAPPRSAPPRSEGRARGGAAPACAPDFLSPSLSHSLSLYIYIYIHTYRCVYIYIYIYYIYIYIYI